MKYRVSQHNCPFCFARQIVSFKDIQKLFSELDSVIFGNFLEIIITLITDKLIKIWLIFDNFLKNDSNTNLRVFIFWITITVFQLVEGIFLTKSLQNRTPEFSPVLKILFSFLYQKNSFSHIFLIFIRCSGTSYLQN